MRIDQWLKCKYPQYSRSYFQFLIENSFVKVNKKHVNKSYVVSPNDVIDVEFVETKPSKILAEDIPLNILYEDPYFLIVDKPANMVVHPAPGNWTGTFANGLINYCNVESDEKSNLRPGIVHRLDKETSGVLIAAKTILSKTEMSNLFSKRQVDKVYVLIAEGKLPENFVTVDLEIGRDPKDRKKMKASSSLDNSKASVTNFKVIDYKNGFSFVEASPLTGRQHQIRVHLQHLGLYIIGESKYRSCKSGFSRHMLHAYSVEFIHPFYNEKIKIFAKIPKDFQKACLKYGFEKSAHEYC